MPFNTFREKCEEIARKSGINCDAIFNDDGKYTARFSDGVKITGNSVSLKVGVFWGSGHSSTATI